MIALTASEIDNLLTKLCVDLGFCLPPRAISKLKETPPADIDSFTDAVFIAEGFDLRFANRRLYAQVRAIVRDAFARAASIQTHK